MIAIMAFAVLLANAAFAATIYGTIYDFSLEKANDIRLEINTEPKQSYISKNGSYAFNVPNGQYSIEAKQYTGSLLKASAAENITVKDSGNYVLDLILFPSVDEGNLEESIEVNDPFEERKLNTTIILASIIIILLFIAYAKSKSKAKTKDKKQEDYDLEKVIKIIKKEGGRATQKAIRKEIPLSEAKISLMIAELEHKGIIEKIKKGRGNIIILKK